MGSGLSIRNDTDTPLLIILSQLTPLYWKKCDAGETIQFETGKVWFTVSASVYNEGDTPTAEAVALRLAAITAGYMLGPVGFLVTGVVSGMTSSRGIKRDGVYADGRCIVIKSRTSGEGTCFEPYFHSFVISDKNGKTRSEEI